MSVLAERDRMRRALALLGVMTAAAGCAPPERDFTTAGSAGTGSGVTTGSGGVGGAIPGGSLAEGAACTPEENRCGGGLVCAELETGGHACYPPVFVTGQVVDSQVQAAIPSAHVIALDAQGKAISDAGITDAAGNYTLQVSAVRTATGEPAPALTLWAGATGYQTFPGGLRTARPVAASGAEKKEIGWVIASPQTRIALVKLPDSQPGRAAISGKVLAGAASAGVLVVAEGGSAGAAPSAIADASGSYTIFNVPTGNYLVRGYAAGIQLESRAAAVSGEDTPGVDLPQSQAALGSVLGQVAIVNAPGGSATSVVLVPKSTFIGSLARGEVPRGLRTPLSGAPNVTGDFKIDNVPVGTYLVLAAFENDGLVLDPDTSIGGTQIAEVTMLAPGESRILSVPFKLTEALIVISPGKDDAEPVSGKPPTFTWVDDSGEVSYSVEVHDSFGSKVWETNIPGFSGTLNASVQYAGPALIPGLYYQFRVTSLSSNMTPLSRTEDLRGVFFLQPPLP